MRSTVSPHSTDHKLLRYLEGTVVKFVPQDSSDAAKLAESFAILCSQGLVTRKNIPQYSRDGYLITKLGKKALEILENGEIWYSSLL